MSSSRRPMRNAMMAAMRAAVLLAAAGATQAATAAQDFPGIGRAATPKEIAAWDIDVRPDFKGLPPGRGSVAQGQELWEAKCAACHGVFGESGEVFNPLVGGTTADDIRTGHVATLKRTDYPVRTTLMKVATVSTLWDYIRRAMPWNQPKSLSPDEVYAALAYLLNLGGIVPADFTLSNTNIAEVQQRMPNRNGMSTQHAMWPGDEFAKGAKPDVLIAKPCMKDCEVPTKVSSMIPDFAMNAHGDLAQQNRNVGPQRGLHTAPAASAASAPSQPVSKAAEVQAITTKSGCVACHAPDRKVLGPSWADVAKRHAGKADYLVSKIRSGGTGTWGDITMPPQTGPSEADVRRIAEWLAEGAQP